MEETVAAAVARVPAGGGATNCTATATHHGETFTDSVTIRPPVSYIDADGVERQCIRYTVLEPRQSTYGETDAENWYVVTNDVAYAPSLDFHDAHAHLILCDGAALSASSSSFAIYSSGSLTIYGQSGGTGAISASADINAIYARGGIIVNGGIVEATTPDPNTYYGISADRTVTINGGVVRGSVCGTYGIAVNGGVVESPMLLAGNDFDIVLGWKNATDSITAAAYLAGSVSVKAGQSLTDGTTVYQGAVDPAAIAGKTLRPHLSWEQLQAMLDAGGAVTLPGDATAADGDATLTVTNAVTLDLNGHTIDADGQFGVIEVLEGGDLTLTNGVPRSGAITGGHSDYGGGGVCVSGGVFTMTGGTISGNTAVYGGGVYVDGGAFTMTGGEISGNTVHWNGGGVYVTYGAFTMSGGTVSGNKAGNGGGVYVYDGTFTVSGSPFVSVNTNSVGAADNVYLSSGRTIAVDGLSAGASIGVMTATAPTATSPVAFATGATAGDAAHFTSDKPTFAIDAANGELRLWKPTTPWDLLQALLDAGGTVTLANDVTAADGDATLLVTNAVTLDLNGHTIDAAGRFGVIRVLEGGDLTLTNSVEGSGAVTGGSGNCGGGVYVTRGTFEMSGGTICSNNAASSGGGVFATDGSTFTISGGLIANNHAANGGGGVYVDGNSSRSTFTMTGGTISGNEAYCIGGSRICGGGGVCVNGGTFAMTNGAISGNVAHCTGESGYGGGGVYVNNGGAFEMSDSAVSGNAAGNGGGVFVNNGTFKVSGVSTVSGNTNAVGAAANVYLPSGKKIAVNGLSPDASIGVTTDPAPTESSPVAFATGASEGDEAHFFSDDPSCRIGFENGTLWLFRGAAYPAYLAGADECVTNNWLAWAGRHGAVTNDEYEAAFLLDVAPADLATCTGALLRVSAFAPAEAGVRLELACDIPGYRFFQPEGDDVTVLGNGYVGLAVARDLAALAGETPPIPVPATVDAATGRAVLDLDFGLYLQALGAPPGYTPPLPASLFARPVLTPVRPDLEVFLLVIEP